MSEQQANNVEMEELRRRRNQWYWTFVIWQGISWILLVTIAAGSAVFASELMKEQHALATNSIALAVAVASAFLAALQPQQRAKSYREAWIELDLAIKTLEKVPSLLVEALRKGENLIGDSHTDEHPKV